MKPHAIRLHIGRLVVDQATLSGGAVNEASLAAALDQAMQSRFPRSDHAPVNGPLDSISALIAEAIWREAGVSQLRGVATVALSKISDVAGRPVPTEDARSVSQEFKS
jgi:hypothetical protein